MQFVAVNLEELQRGRSLEEGGVVGSRALAAHAKENGWAIQGVIVLESVAYTGNSVVQSAPEGLPIEIPKVGNFIAVVGNERSLELVQGFSSAVERYRIDLPVVPLVVPGNGEMFPDTRRSDHSPFWDQGYKAIMLTDTTEFRSPHYHKMSDTFETLNLPFAAQVCRATGGLVIEVAGLTLEDQN